jgi:murein DD-endopeptidase MepM/ murein hydrolase activator NlpD
MRPPRLSLALVASVLIVAPSAVAGIPDGRVLAVSKAAFDWPANGTVTSPFGFRPGGFHSGIDIGMLRSLSVRAATDGRVVLAGTPVGFEGYGNLIGVDVGGGMLTLYAHLAQVNVKVGDLVSIDQPIGIAGCTGSCSGTHLHFEVRLNGRPVDPMPYLAG